MRYLTVKELAARLNVSRSVVYACIAAGHLPHVRVGVGRGTIRISERDADAFEERLKRDEQKAWSEHFA